MKNTFVQVMILIGSVFLFPLLTSVPLTPLISPAVSSGMSFPQARFHILIVAVLAALSMLLTP
jgi:hypothetical protein